jgi:signal transduction histidine kinase
MPEITGVEFLEKSIETHPDTIRILLTGYTDIESVIESVNKAQIYRYLTKPWDTNDLLNTVDQAYEKYLLKGELKIKNDKLTEALNELQNLDKAKSQFMILINHELKTPLTSIISFSSLLKETLLSEEQNLFTERIIKSSDKLKKIIDDVLVIVKGEVGLIYAHDDTVDLNTIIKNLPNKITQNLKSKNQNLILKIETGPISSDLNLLSTAVHRAIHNATKFGTAGTDIVFAAKTTSNGKNAISITNQGPHISEAVLNKILKPFQLDENVMNHSVGMGLGLTICQTLIKALKGSMNVRNIENGVSVEFQV